MKQPGRRERTFEEITLEIASIGTTLSELAQEMNRRIDEDALTEKEALESLMQYSTLKGALNALIWTQQKEVAERKFLSRRFQYGVTELIYWGVIVGGNVVLIFTQLPWLFPLIMGMIVGAALETVPWSLQKWYLHSAWKKHKLERDGIPFPDINTYFTNGGERS